MPIDCDDDNLCNGAEWCESLSVGYACRSGTPTQCNDLNVCNGVESCDPDSGCEHGVPLDCDDDNPCTDNWCDPVTGCEQAHNSRSCDDGNSCTKNDQCQGGSCVPGPPMVCNNGNPCDGVETCNTLTGCVDGTPIACDDGLACTLDSCDPAVVGYCVHSCVPTPPPDGLIPTPDDRTFVFEADVQLTSGQTYTTPTGIRVTRYAGSTDGDGHLLGAYTLITNGLAGPTAQLEIVTWGVQAGSQHRVFFNDVEIGVLSPSPTCQWSKSVFKIPLVQAKFPSARGSGGPPTARINPVKIIVGGQPTCLRFLAASLSVKLMSPIILIHGNNQDGGFFVRRRFTGHLSGGLSDQHLLFDNSISMDTASRTTNAEVLDSNSEGADIPKIATSFGVDSVHLVAHSKGGLDVRDYLERFQKNHESQFKVLSLTTLSTPHNGSILADVSDAYSKASAEASQVDFSGFPLMTGLITYLDSFFTDEGRPSLTTKDCADFNLRNIRELPDGIVYNTVSADADCSGNHEIDAPLTEEWLDLFEEEILAVPYAVNKTYQILRNTKAVVIEYYQTRMPLSPRIPVWAWETVGVVTADPGGPYDNDTAVTAASAQGFGSFKTRVRPEDTKFLGWCANHSSVADERAAGYVGPWIVAVEREIGDLR